MLEIIGWSLVALWLISFIYNLFYFLNRKDETIDTIFLNTDKSFEEAYKDIEILENYLGKNLDKVKRKLAFYEENARLTRRKYSYYVDYIEPAITRIYFGDQNNLKSYWRGLCRPVKMHYGILTILFLGLVLFLVYIGLGIAIEESLFLIFPLIFLLVLVLRFFQFIIKANYLIFFILIDWMLMLFSANRGGLYKNLAILEQLTKNWWGNGGGGMVIGAAGVSGYSGGGGGFGGFGGGSFGGGGAGGSW